MDIGTEFGVTFLPTLPSALGSRSAISLKVKLPSWWTRQLDLKTSLKACFELNRKSVRRLTTRRAARRQQYNVAQEPKTVSLWLCICLASYRAVKDALQFLLEQPGQLKDIEWPSFQSTIRMVVLTVVVVTLLIIFLATIDSTFSYVLASILRRVRTIWIIFDECPKPKMNSIGEEIQQMMDPSFPYSGCVLIST